MPETSCFPIPDSMSYDQAAISEPLAIGVYAVRLANIDFKGKNVGILGFGSIGMSVILPLLQNGAKNVYVTDKIDGRLALAKKSGAVWIGNPDAEDVVEVVKALEPALLDVVFECCGKQEAVNQAIEMLKPGGKLMLIGIPEFDRWSLPVDKMRHKEVCIQNVRRQNGALEETLELLAGKKLDVSLMPSHRYKFDDTQKAFDLVAGFEDGVMKAMIDFE